jgi:hypothetical protein
MSKTHENKREGKKPAAKTAREKHDLKKAKKVESARKEF